MYQVVPYEEFAALRNVVDDLRSEVARLKATQPDWLREEEAQQLTGLSQSTLARERKRPGTLLVVTDSGPLRYLRSSVEAFNEKRSLRRTPHSQAA